MSEEPEDEPPLPRWKEYVSAFAMVMVTIYVLDELASLARDDGEGSLGLVLGVMLLSAGAGLTMLYGLRQAASLIVQGLVLCVVLSVLASVIEWATGWSVEIALISSLVILMLISWLIEQRSR